MEGKAAQSLNFLNGGGEMGALIRTKDWSEVSIGTPEKWPESLRTAVSILLNSSFPMFVWWGDDLITIYNDAYRQIAGEKHPLLLGKSGKEGCAEIWDDLSPLVKTVFSGNATWSEDQVLYMNRHGYVEETYFTFSYSPIIDESGTVAGLFCACIETTEKVLAARRISKSERNLRNTILQAPVAMCILRGPSFVVEVANVRMYELWGKTAEEMQHKPVFEGLYEARYQGLEELLQQVYKTGKTVSANERPVALPRNGKIETVFINFVYEPLREVDGSVSGIIVVATDETEQVTVRQKLEENEAELQSRVEERTADLQQQKAFISSILNASFSGIYALKTVRNAEGAITDFRYLFVNNKIAQMLNLEAEKIIGSTMLQLIPENQNNGFFSLFCKVLQTGETVHDVTHFVTETINNWYDYVMVPINRDIVVVTIQDITEQKMSALHIEQQRNLLDNILTNSSNGISATEMIRDKAGNVIDARTILANDAAVKNTGLPRDVYLTKTAIELDPDILSSPYGKACLKTLETGEPSLIQYYLEVTGRWLELTISKMDDDHLIHIFTDVTPVKEAQLQLERTIEELKRSNANLEEFAYAASHDMKEPIRKIHFFADRLKSELRDELNDRQKHLFGRLEHSAQRMSALIDDLLTYSHVSKGISHLEMVDLNVKVKNVLEDLELEIEQKNATINVGTLPVIMGHKRQMQQLFQNMISNALKYSKANTPPEITITAHKVLGNQAPLSLNNEEANKEYHLIEISDKGIGFKQEDAERMFNVFIRLHSNTEYKGTGVGLSIVQKVVENHKGHIWAEGEPDKGATFRILLPVA